MTTEELADYSPDPTLTPLQHRIITRIASGQPITQASTEENIHRNTVGYWRRTVPAFARELEFATREQRFYWHEQVTLLASKAIEAIHSALTSPDSSPSLRFRAATLILKMATGPQNRTIQGFPALPAEVEAISGQKLSSSKENQQKENRPQPEAPQEPSAPHAGPLHTVQSAEIPIPAQSCTKPQPIRVTVEPGRNTPCPCGSGVKLNRCCGNSPAQARSAA